MPEKYLTAKPTHLSYEASAALPIAGLSAFQTVLHLARLSSEKRVLVIGASGGVGHMAVQIAKAFGIHVSAVCSGKNTDFVRSLGADEVIDYSKTDLTTLPESSFDAVLDFVSAHRFGKMRHLLRACGRYIYTFVTPSALIWSFLSYFTGTKRVRILALRPNANDARDLVELAQTHKLSPHIEKVFSLEQVKEACALSESGHARGKLIIRIAS